MTYSKQTAERLIAEAVEDDERLSSAPWSARMGCSEFEIIQTTSDGDKVVLIDGCTHRERDDEFIEFHAIARTRNNLASMAEQLRAAVAEIDQWKRVAGAADENAHRFIEQRDSARARIDTLSDALDSAIQLTHVPEHAQDEVWLAEQARVTAVLDDSALAAAKETSK